MKSVPVLMMCGSMLAAQTWNVRMIRTVPQTAQSLDGDPAKLKIEGDMLVCESRGEWKWQVSFDAIRDLSHSTRVRNRGALTLEDDSSNSRGTEGVGALGVLLFAAALSTSKVQWEYVTIAWRENQVYRTKIVRLRKADLPPFRKGIEDADVAGCRRRRAGFEGFVARN
jgi:hypothetical protein